MFRGINLKSNLPTLGLGAAIGGIVVFLGTSSMGCGRGGDVMALVNGEAISKDEFFKYMELKPQVRVQTANGVANLAVDQFLGIQVLQDLIAQQATLQLAKDKKIDPTSADIAKELEFKGKLIKNFLVNLTERGLSLDMIRKSIRIDLIQERLLTEGITVTSADVDKYIKDNPKEFIEPERADLSWILVYDEPSKKKVDESLGTLTFNQVGVKYSKAPHAKESSAKLVDEATGQMPAVDTLPAGVKEQIAKTPEGGTTEWVRMVTGYAKFKVNKIVAQRAVPLDDTKKEYLRRELAKRKGMQARNIDKAIVEKMKASDIKVMTPMYQKPWSNIATQFSAENKLEDLTGGRR